MPPVVRLNSASTTTTVVNTATETVLSSFTVPAYLYTTKRATRLVGTGELRVNDPSPPTLTFNLRVRSSTGSGLGTLIAGTTNLTFTSSTKNRYWSVQVDTVGTSTADQRHAFTLSVSEPSTAAFRPVETAWVGYGTSTQDYNDALVVQVAAKWSTANSSGSVDHRVGWIEAVR